MSGRSFRCRRLIPTVMLLTVACSRVPTAPGRPSFESDQTYFTDAELRAAAYSSYLWPANFDPEAATLWAANAYYLNTLSIAPLSQQPSEYRELDTEQLEEAKAWAESTYAHSQYTAPPDLEHPRVTSRYIEIPSLPVPGWTVTNPLRAHRTSYLVRSVHDRFHPDTLRGILEARPVDVASSKAVVEYIWALDEPSRKLLSSFGHEEAGEVTHTIFDLAVSYGDWGLCDQLILRRLEYRVSKVTGRIVRTETKVRTALGHCH